MQWEVVKGSWRNDAARTVLKRYGMPSIPVWNDTVPLWDFHRCSHAVLLSWGLPPAASLLPDMAGALQRLAKSQS